MQLTQEDPIRSPITADGAISEPSVQPVTSRKSKSNKADREMILPLTGLRALAAIWVVCGHFVTYETDLFPAVRFIAAPLKAAALGVDLFFVLSGFILSLNYVEKFARVDRKAYFRFLWMRLARIYPVHLFTLLFLLAAVLAARHAHIQLSMPERLQPHSFVTNVFLVQIWNYKHPPSWNGPAWSISAEWFAYLLFPFFCSVFLLARSPCASLLGAIAAFAILLGGFSMDINHPLFRVSFDFAAGCFIYRLYSLKWHPEWPWATIAIATVAATIGFTYLAAAYHIDLENSWAAPMMGILIFALASSSRGLSRVLSMRPRSFSGRPPIPCT